MLGLSRGGQEPGHVYLGSGIAEIPLVAKKRRLMHCRSAETVNHVQAWCPALKKARIAAHHLIAVFIFSTLHTVQACDSSTQR